MEAKHFLILGLFGLLQLIAYTARAEDDTEKSNFFHALSFLTVIAGLALL